ncbi:piggyBac transposable element-derived protein 4-like [Vespa velutina]|uniref:piggyBac transposable element-derived protein 4-like n=1 Tax=Vespa velutina TaxID=202808 RepID=UPI001FB342BD|nr:piggyBac transposable element-derived protein 4-like [Vespa velutina]
MYDSISEQGFSIDIRLSNLSLSAYTTLRETEWQTIQATQAEKEVAEPEREHDAELLIENINCNDPLELYELFVTDSIILLMVQQTNKYAMEIGTDKKHQTSWIPVSIGEMKAFLGILLIMGVVQMPDIRFYWAENSMYGNERSMKRDRFLSILKDLHFADNETCTLEDPLYKIRNFMKYMLSTFKNTVKLGKTVVIDESMILWRGRLRFRRYVKGKRHKYRIKLYKLCLPNGYTYDLEVYSGKSSISSTNGHSYDVVEKLMNDLKFEEQTYFCGTVQQNRKFLPAEAKKKEKRGEILAMENSSGIKCVKWTDKRTVFMLTTCKNHKCILIEGKPGKMKPHLVFDYNNAKKGVDLSDQMASYYNCLIVKWEKIIDRLLTTEKMSIRQIKDSNFHFVKRYIQALQEMFASTAGNVTENCQNPS